ncbi:hypothetical protein OIO90_006184 [Microbotryomycetes sp. JL221]|nr:hypothetical protein OIO90_006184 [Microbotryomycetes sp. JL221]
MSKPPDDESTTMSNKMTNRAASDEQSPTIHGGVDGSGVMSTRPTLSPRLRSTSVASQLTTSDWFQISNSTATGSNAFDLPSSSCLASSQLEPTLSRQESVKSVRYTGGISLQSTATTTTGTTKRVPTRTLTSRSGAISRDDRIHEHDDEQVGSNVVDSQSSQITKHDHHQDQDDSDDELQAEKRRQQMYARFSDRRKSIITAIVAYVALLAQCRRQQPKAFASSSFLPSIPQICDELNTTPTIINVTVCIYILTLAVCPLLWAPYSAVYGRRPIYLISLPLFSMGCLGVALSSNLTSLIITRIIQGAGSSSVLSVGAGTISDLYPKEVRGGAMGLFYLGVLFGPAISPAIAGVLTEYVRPIGQGWRAMQWLLCAMGVSGTILCFFFLPETCHQRGVELIRAERQIDNIRNKRDKKVSSNEKKQEEGPEVDVKLPWYKDFVWVWMNPIRPLRLLMLPHILALSLNSSFVLMSTYTVLVPLSQTVAPRYNISNSAILGLFYLAQGIGNLLASPFSGRYADYMLRHYLNKRQGVYVPEDRLRATLIGGGLLLPMSVVILGWVLDKVQGTVGLVLTIVLLFLDGAGLMFVLTPANTYCVDVSGPRSSEVIAVNNCLRYIFSAGSSAFVLPMIDQVGVGVTNTFAAGLCWCGFGLVLLTIKFGKQMRRLGERVEGIQVMGADEKRSDWVHPTLDKQDA